MPSVGVKLYSVFFKLLLKHRLQSHSQATSSAEHGVTSRPDSGTVPANPGFVDGIATKDIHIDHRTNLSVRIFLPDSSLEARPPLSDPANNTYRGYLPKDCSASTPAAAAAAAAPSQRRLPVIFQFHGGGFVTGSNDSASNDLFCRRLAKLCDSIIIAVGYRLAPEHRFPAAFDDGLEAVKWFAKQANLAECNRSFLHLPKAYPRHDLESHREIMNNFGSSMVEPWLAAHADPSRCVLLGVSSGANIADYVARKAVQAARVLEPVKVVAQVLMYPFFIGSTPTHSEIKLANSYFFDKATCILAWKLFLPDGEFDLDHAAANPLIPGREPPLKLMPPTLTVVAELDWMKDRAIAYSEALRKFNIDAPVLEYKDAVHEFATLDMLVKSRQAEACADDIAIWIKKYISLKGHEFSY